MWRVYIFISQSANHSVVSSRGARLIASLWDFTPCPIARGAAVFEDAEDPRELYSQRLARWPIVRPIS